MDRYRLEDSFTVFNALSPNPKTVPAHVWFRLRWHGGGGGVRVGDADVRLRRPLRDWSGVDRVVGPGGRGILVPLGPGANRDDADCLCGPRAQRTLLRIGHARDPDGSGKRWDSIRAGRVDRVAPEVVHELGPPDHPRRGREPVSITTRRSGFADARIGSARSSGGSRRARPEEPVNRARTDGAPGLQPRHDPPRLQLCPLGGRSPILRGGLSRAHDLRENGSQAAEIARKWGSVTCV